MKLRVAEDISCNLNDLRAHRINSTKEYFDKYCNKNGVMYDEDNEFQYYDIEVEQMPIEGQRVGTRWGYKIVKCSMYELEPSSSDNIYDNSYIIVEDE